MAECIEIEGGVPLSGTVEVSGAKNAVLPLLIASLLTEERCHYTNVPSIQDVPLTLQLLQYFGADVEYLPGKVSIKVEKLLASEASYSLVRALRASFWILGPLLARGGAARVALPGGDIIGPRPVDMHLEGLTKMGADITLKNGVVFATAIKGLKPASIDLRMPSVGATHQIMLAASKTPGTTVIRGAAREPEIVAVANFINSMGGDVEGAGSCEIVVRGKTDLKGATVKLIGDRIEAATFALAGLATRGKVTVRGFDPAFFGEFLEILERMGGAPVVGSDYVTVSGEKGIKPIHVATGPFPVLATDIQAPLLAALCAAEGESKVEEHIFEGRFGHVSELCRMGAHISVSDHTATISGGYKLSGAQVEANDIRAAAALMIAGFAAEGITHLHEPQHIRRGYSNIEQKFAALGGRIGARLGESEEFLLAGC